MGRVLGSLSNGCHNALDRGPCKASHFLPSVPVVLAASNVFARSFRSSQAPKDWLQLTQFIVARALLFRVIFQCGLNTEVLLWILSHDRGKSFAIKPPEKQYHAAMQYLSQQEHVHRLFSQMSVSGSTNGASSCLPRGIAPRAAHAAA